MLRIMSRAELNPISYVVLGLVARDGPITSYGLKQAADRGPARLWQFRHTQLYTEPARLAEAGLLRERREPGGRRRRTYTITEAGRQALEAWVTDPSAGEVLLRDESVMKLYFGAFSSPEAIAGLAQTRAAEFREGYQEILEAEQRLLARGDRLHQLTVLRWGLRFVELMAGFWDEVAADPGAERTGT